MKRIIAIMACIIALGTLILSFTACKKEAGINTLYEGNAVKIEREGNITRIYDIAGNAKYTFSTRRARVKAAEIQTVEEVKTAAKTETIDIKTISDIIIVTTADGKTLFIKEGGK